MQFIDLGFLFLLLPMSAAVYYCVPNRHKPVSLLLISLFFYYLMQPAFIGLMLTVIPDVMLMAHAGKDLSSDPKNALFLRLCVVKNMVLMLLLGILFPLLHHTAPPVGIMVISLSLTELLIMQHRDKITFASPIQTASATLFFGRFINGPVGSTQNLIVQLAAPTPSLSRIARGIMLLITGVAKRVVLAEQFFALLKSMSRLSPEHFSIALSWLCALCSALGIYFSLSAYSDIAMGIGNVFSLQLPRMLYYPFQSRSIREYIYRLNMPLEDTVFHLVFPKHSRDTGDNSGYFISFCMPLLLALWLSPSGGYLLWGGYLACLVVLDWLLLRKIPVPVTFAARTATFVITLPAYVLMLPATLGTRFTMISVMFGLGDAPLFNDAVIYLFSSNFVLIIIGILACSNIFDLLGRATERQFPQLWWAGSLPAHLALLVVATSFLLWNVR